MPDSSATDRHHVEKLAESFLAVYRTGVCPTVEQYVEQFPELADQLRDLLAALVMLEQHPPCAESAGRPHADRRLASPEFTSEIGDFRIIRKIARGGMGIVYEAIQQSLGRRVALKVLTAHGIPGTNHLERFRLESRAASRLHHTHIVPVFAVGESQGLHYYAMQFIEGKSLDLVIDELRRWRNSATLEYSGSDRSATLTHEIAEGLQSGEFTVPRNDNSDVGSASAAGSVPGLTATSNGIAAETAAANANPAARIPESTGLISSRHGRPFYQSVARVGLQVAEAISYAHGEGILHRDIKPSNLLIDMKGCVWVTDFGLAKTEDSEALTQTGDFVGTLRYMAPERLQGKSDHRSDLYSLGATLYELLTLRPFLDASSRGQLIDKILHDAPSRPSKFDADVPRDLETIILKAIARDPGARYQSAALIAEDLTRFLTDRPIKARRANLIEQFTRWCRRNPAVSTLLSLVAVLLFAAVAILSASNLRIRDAQESTRRTLYVDDVNLASHIWESSHGTRRQVTELLMSYRPQPGEADLREFAWRYQWSRIERGTRAYQGPERPRGLAIDRHDRLLALDSDGTVFIWEAIDSDDPELLTLASDFTPEMVALAPAGNFVALSKPEGEIWIVDLNSRELQHPLALNSTLKAMRFSDNGLFLVGVDQLNKARVWDVTAGVLLHEMELKHENFLFLALSADGGRCVLSRSPGTTVAMYDMATATCHELRKELSDFYSNECAISPDGRFVVAGCEGGYLRTWSTSSETEQWRVSTGSAAGRTKFFPDGRRLVVGSSTGNLSIWDFESRTQLRVLKGPLGSIVMLAIAANGQSVASIDSSGVLRRWDISLAEDARIMPHRGGQIDNAVYSADGRWLALASQQTGVQLAELTGTREFVSLDSSPARKVAFSPNGRWLAAGCADAGVRIFDLPDGQLRCTLAAPADVAGFLPGTDWQIPRDAGSLQFDQDSQWLAVAYGNTTTFDRDFASGFVIWSISEAKVRHVFPTDTQITALALSPDGSLLAAAGHNGKIWLCSTKNWVQPEVWVNVPRAGFSSAVFSPDGRCLLTGTGRGEIQIRDLKSRQLLRTLNAHGERVSSMAISPDHQTLATCSWDRTVKLWHIPTFRELTTIPASHTWLYSVNFSPNGNSLAAGGVDSKLRLWDAAPLDTKSNPVIQSRP